MKKIIFVTVISGLCACTSPIPPVAPPQGDTLKTDSIKVDTLKPVKEAIKK